MSTATLDALLMALRQAQADESPQPVVVFVAGDRTEISDLIRELEAVRARFRFHGGDDL